MKKLVQFGAGNIGRSFIGQVFSRGGWEVVFVDVNLELVAALNKRRGYPIVVKRSGHPDKRIDVRGVRAVDGRDADAVAAEIASADCLASSVGKAALPRIFPNLAAGLLARRSAAETVPLNLILAENDREAVGTVREGLRALLPAGFRLEERLGLVETSIGKMVPIMRSEELAADNLLIFAEEYNSLVVDRRGFLGPIPDLPDLEPVDNILAYVDRKLFVHNLGHAAVAYLGHRADPSETAVSRVLRLTGVRAAARRAMTQAADALALEYPADLDRSRLESHIDDLLFRFGNEALGDTVYRVGRDLPRKLDRSDRVLGAALLCERHGLPWDAIYEVFGAALGFRAVDEAFRPFPADKSFIAVLERDGLEETLKRVCKLDPDDPVDKRVLSVLATVVV